MHPYHLRSSAHFAHFARAHRRGRRISRALGGLTLAALGTLLYLRQQGLVADVRVGRLWPLLLVWAGLSGAARRRDAASVAMGLALALFGAGMVGDRLGLTQFGVAEAWPLLLVAGGLALTLRAALGRGGPPGAAGWRPAGGLDAVRVATATAAAAAAPEAGGPAAAGPEADSPQADPAVLQHAVSLGGAQVRNASQQLRGGHLSASLGGLEVDLRGARLAGDEAVLEVSVSMGNIELRVPEGWRVISQVVTNLGALEDTTAPGAGGGEAGPRLVLRGEITMGAVTVRN